MTDEQADWLDDYTELEREQTRLWVQADEEKNQAIRSVEIETNAKG